MSDLVQTLRDMVYPCCEEAADEIARLRAALREAADELDAYYRAEYPGDHPYSQKKLAAAMAANPARAALEASNG